MTANLETASPAPSETGSTASRSRWESIIWPRWLPIRARLPLIAQIAGAAALIAALGMPRWSEVAPTPTVPPVSTVAPVSTLPSPSAVPQSSTVAPASNVASASVVHSKPGVPDRPMRPAHLNLDVRHAFRSMDLSISVDGRPVLDTTLEGSGKRFKVFGKRAEKGYTKSLDLPPGVRVVRVRVRSAADKFDQTRVERFDLDSASVAGMRIAADKTGLSVIADRPQVIERTTVAPVAPVAPVAQVAQVAAVAQATQATQTAQAQQASALAELYQSLRSILIAVAGFIGSAATGFVVQEFLRSRKEVMGR